MMILSEYWMIYIVRARYFLCLASSIKWRLTMKALLYSIDQNFSTLKKTQNVLAPRPTAQEPHRMIDQL